MLAGAPVGGVLFVAAGAVAFVVVSLQLMLTGDAASRALWASIAAVALAVISIVAREFGSLFERVCGRDLARGHLIRLTALAIVFSGLGVAKNDWLPGVLDRCYTPPFSHGMTAFVEAAGGGCYGLIDEGDAGPLGPGSFGRNPVASDLERRILKLNRPLERGDLTVIWLGSLSCEYSRTDPTRCADGRDYPAERDQLRGLLMAQLEIARSTGHHLHVVIGDAAQDVAHIDDVARLIVANRAAFGGRLAVVGGGDSREVTQSAINRLLDDGIPFIAPNLLADLGNPGRPFVDRPGYLQLAAPNRTYATDTVARIAKSYPHGFRLAIFQLPAPSDQYTTSLVNDLLAAVARLRASGVEASARQVRGLDQIDVHVLCVVGVVRVVRFLVITQQGLRDLVEFLLARLVELAFSVRLGLPACFFFPLLLPFCFVAHRRASL